MLADVFWMIVEFGLSLCTCDLSSALVLAGFVLIVVRLLSGGGFALCRLYCISLCWLGL